MITHPDVVSGSAFFLCGAVLAVLSLRLPVWSPAGPLEGFFPLVVAIIILSLSAAVGLRPFLATKAFGDKERGDTSERRGRLRHVGMYGGLTLGYGLALDLIGFPVTTAIFLIVILRYVEAQNWRRTLLVVALSILLSDVLFGRLLGVPLPNGALDW